MRVHDSIREQQGRTLPLGKGRRLPWAPESQGPPKMRFIYEMRNNRGHAYGCLLPTGVYYRDNRLRVRVERASCASEGVSLSQSSFPPCVVPKCIAFFLHLTNK